MGYVFSSGRTVHFANGLLTLTNEKEIEEMTATCQDSPCFYIDDGQKTIDPDTLNPVAVLRAQLKAEILAEQAAANVIGRDLGTTDQTSKLQGISNSAGIGAFAAASGSNQESVSMAPSENVLANITPSAGGAASPVITPIVVGKK